MHYSYPYPVDLVAFIRILLLLFYVLLKVTYPIITLVQTRLTLEVLIEPGALVLPVNILYKYTYSAQNSTKEIKRLKRIEENSNSSNMPSSSSFPDVFSWIQNLQWKNTNNNSINLCPQDTSSQPSLKLSINTSINSQYFTLSVFADYTNLTISLWTSKKILLPKKITPEKSLHNFIDETSYTLLCNIIQGVLKYCSYKHQLSLKLPRNYNFKDIFNFSFLSLVFVVCIYEAPKDIRASCLDILKDQFACPESRGVSKDLMRLLGSNTEEQWMRSMNLAITNWISELQAANVVDVKMPSPLFSYSFSTFGLWKVHVYCPVIAMSVDKASGSSPDERLVFSLNYHQLESVILLNYRVVVKEKWIEVNVSIDNIRCDVISLLSDKLMKERGAGASEKHFPSRISLHITPTSAMQPNVISVSVSKSSENHPTEIGHETGMEASFEPPKAIGLHLSTGETVATSLKPWKFEQSVYGNSANLNWFLHDRTDGREVFSSKPSKLALLHPKSWFKNRYSKAHRPFTRQGGVIFAGDEYGESVTWKVDKGCCMGEVMEWEIKGLIWLTYWPNKRMTFYTETRRLEFREIVHLTLV